MTVTMAGKRGPGWWYPWIYAGVFLVVVAVNLGFAFVAVRSFTGVEANAYEKGLAYNQTLTEARAQERLGWAVEARLAPADTAGAHARALTVAVRGADGRPLTGLAVEAQFRRPTAAGHDLSLPLAETMEGGVYGGVAPLALPGQWELSVIASKGEDRYRIVRRVVVP